MNKILKMLTNVLKRGGFAFLYYPVSMIFAIAMAVLSSWLIHAEPATNLKLFTALQITFVFGALLNMALCVSAKKADGGRLSFILSSAVSVVVSAGVFFALYLPKGTDIREESMMRVAAAGVISYLVFVIAPTFRSRKIHYNEMVFMNVKSFFIAAVYDIVLMLGLFFVAFAFQKLIYENMTDKVYPYIAIGCGLIGYTFFLGYFPEFKKDEDENDPRIDSIIKQPRFAEILFQNIMLPVIGAMTVVLLIWSIRILITWEWPVYTQTISIFTTYALAGIFVYFLVSSYDRMIVRLYRKIFPIATLVFLAFEAYPIYNRILQMGVQPGEYAIVFVWIYAVVTSILFLLLPIQKNRIQSYLAMALIAVFVLPVIGAGDASFTLQGKRLESLLNHNNMLVSGKIISSGNVTLSDKEKITSATNYLFSQQDKAVPKWLSANLQDLSSFEKVYGFQPTYPDQSGPVVYTSSITLKPENKPVALEGYQYYISSEVISNTNEVEIKTQKETYIIRYLYSTAEQKAGKAIPGITLTAGKEKILEGDLTEVESAMRIKYLPVGTSGEKGEKVIPVDEMSRVFTSGKVQIKMIFRTINLTRDSNGIETCYFDLQGIYFKELE